ncbi:MAG: hypothetical protein OHK0052_12170 [Anaerolineales bacterium]
MTKATSQFSLPWWVWLIALIVIAAGLFFWLQPDTSFQLIGGDKTLIVLLREQGEAVYQLRYEGSQPAQITNLMVMLAGTTLHTDIAEVTLLLDDQSITLQDGAAAPPLTVQPADIVRVQVRYAARSIGYNYLYGFRVTFEQNNRTQTVDVADPGAKDQKYNYLVDVE